MDTTGDSWVVHHTCNVGGSQLVQEQAAVRTREEEGKRVERFRITNDSLLKTAFTDEGGVTESAEADMHSVRRSFSWRKAACA